MITKFENQYYFLSNFYPIPVFYKGVVYSCSENAYMSAKSDNEEWKLECQKSTNPGYIKRKSRSVDLVDNWDEIKLDVMREVIKCKFAFPSPNKETSLINNLLIRTYPVEIMEGNSWKDKFWGVDEITLEGENHLGKILMERREELIKLYNK